MLGVYVHTSKTKKYANLCSKANVFRAFSWPRLWPALRPADPAGGACSASASVADGDKSPRKPHPCFRPHLASIFYPSASKCTPNSSFWLCLHRVRRCVWCRRWWWTRRLHRSSISRTTPTNTSTSTTRTRTRTETPTLQANHGSCHHSNTTHRCRPLGRPNKLSPVRQTCRLVTLYSCVRCPIL